MTFEEAVRKAMRAYWHNNDQFSALSTSGGDRKYSKKYFDGIESEFLPKKDSSAKEVKKESKGSLDG